MSFHFEDGQKVRVKETGEIVTINRWALSRGPSKRQVNYTYDIIESPATFYFHHELEAVS